MKLCVVSPHLDDALLSCGIRILRHLAGSDEVLCLNIFSAGALSEARKQEDRLALASLGAVPFYLDELDAPDRAPGYRSMRGLFLEELRLEDAYLSRVERRVQDFLNDHWIDVAYFPLGAGNHVDHRIAHEVGRRVRGPAVRFYEDRPYILWPGVLQARMRQLGAGTQLPFVTEQTMAESADAYYYLRFCVPAGQHREETLRFYGAPSTESPASRFAACDEAISAREDELAALYGCLRLYTSQMTTIYPDFDTFLQDSFRSERARTGCPAYIERLWTLAHDVFRGRGN